MAHPDVDKIAFTGSGPDRASRALGTVRGSESSMGVTPERRSPFGRRSEKWPWVDRLIAKEEARGPKDGPRYQRIKATVRESKRALRARHGAQAAVDEGELRAGALPTAQKLSTFAIAIAFAHAGQASRPFARKGSSQ